MQKPFLACLRADAFKAICHVRNRLLLIPAAIINDSYDRWYKGRDCDPRSGPEIS